MSKNKILHIAFVGRLEKEKGIEIVYSIIKKALQENRDIVWHICGDGSYRELFLNLKQENVNVYGHIDKIQLVEIIRQVDLVLMPSLFLETFGLVALEVLSLGIPVCGIRQGGLIDFIHPELEMDPHNPVDSFFNIVELETFPLVNIEAFDFSTWKEHLQTLTNDKNRILLITDYMARVGGAEEYVFFLKEHLESLGKTVELFGYDKKPNQFIRIVLMFLSPISFWRKKRIEYVIDQFDPDLIWMHSILRYIGPHGLSAILHSSSQKYMTHHDLGIISPRPSQIYAQGDIPKDSNLASWLGKDPNVFTILINTYKWLYTTYIWHVLNKDVSMIHLLPSTWLVQYFGKYTHSTIESYNHTTTINNLVKK